MTPQKTVTEMVREMRERADQYEQRFLNGFGSGPFLAFSFRASIQKMRYDADNLEAALKLELERIGIAANRTKEASRLSSQISRNRNRIF